MFKLSMSSKYKSYISKKKTRFYDQSLKIKTIDSILEAGNSLFKSINEPSLLINQDSRYTERNQTEIKK